jgi:hypothetical protein
MTWCSVKHRFKWEGIKIDLKEMGCEGGELDSHCSERGSLAGYEYVNIKSSRISWTAELKSCAA